MADFITRRADTLKRGDVIRWDGQRVVVLAPSDQVDTIPHDQVIELGGKEHPVTDCCEPRIGYLGRTGRMLHGATYIIVPNRRSFRVREFLDLDLHSAVPEPHPELRS
jgi:hypothetical protein